jgi:hypothetical protein
MVSMLLSDQVLFPSTHRFIRLFFYQEATSVDPDLTAHVLADLDLLLGMHDKTYIYRESKDCFCYSIGWFVLTSFTV